MSYRFRLVSSAFAVALSSCACIAAAQQGPSRIYYFVDEQGVPHFSNVPVDSRYKVYSGSEDVTARPAPPPSAAPARVIVPPAPTDEIPMDPQEEYRPNDR